MTPITKHAAFSVVAFLLTVLTLLAVVYALMTQASTTIAEKTITDTLNCTTNAIEVYIERYLGSIHLKNNELFDSQGNSIESNNFFVDTIQKDLNVFATIFKLSGTDFIRVTTNILDENGERATETRLGKDHPGYKTLLAGKIYCGNAILFGTTYMVAYKPIYEEGEIIGLLFLGQDKTKVIDLLNQQKKKVLLYSSIVAVLITVISIIIISNSNREAVY